MAETVLPAPTDPTPTAAHRGSNFQFILRALKYRNYRLFFGGQLISLVGTWLTVVATNWVVYELAKQSLPGRASAILGLVNFAGQIPMFFLSPFGGVWADRGNQHRVIVVTQTLSMLQSFALAFLALRHLITIPHIIILQIFQGVVNAVDVPCRQAFVVKMVENRDDLSNAIALNSSMVHGARLFGPAVAGYLIFRFGAGWCFLIDGISYVGVLVALLMMNVPPFVRARHRVHPLRAIQDGFRYAFGFAPIRTLLILMAVVSLMVASQSVLMPLLVGDVFHRGSGVYGLLLGGSGFGAFVGSIYLASRRTVVGLGPVMVYAAVTLGIALVVLAFSQAVWQALPLLVLLGGAMVVLFAASNTMLQTIVDDDKRGRVMSLFTMAFMGVAPFGSLMNGGLSDAIAGRWSVATGVRATLLLAGIVTTLGGLLFASRLRSLRPLIRPIYVRKGIIREVAEGLQSTNTKASSTPE